MKKKFRLVFFLEIFAGVHFEQVAQFRALVAVKNANLFVLRKLNAESPPGKYQLARRKICDLYFYYRLVIIYSRVACKLFDTTQK
jgi:hypothetical protein